MVLTRWDPLYEIRRAHRLANRRLVGFPAFFDGNGYLDEGEKRDWSIPLDIVKDEDKVTIQASLPGINPDDIDVTIEDGVLTIKAETHSEEERKDGEYVVRERRVGSFHRSLRLSEHVDTDKVEPRYENGVLTITLPVAEAKKAKRLKVSAGTALPEGK
ncbi:MAG: Hsp20/alpha crystallin family protein [SAR202 cluster bacterium]|nr:Hsp20/alpha crystallin family protein [SAR202 cluster bacterium]